MHCYSHHIGDFCTATVHLSRLERSVYREALDLYYDTEEPLSADFDWLARRLRCTGDDERAALQFVLQEFFDIAEDGRWAHARCDREIAAYRKAVQQADEAKGSVNQRQHNHRQVRKQMAAELRAAGVAFAWNIKTADLRALHAEHFGRADLSRTGHAPVTANHSPLTTIPSPETPPNPPAGGAVTGDKPQHPEAGGGASAEAAEQPVDQGGSAAEQEARQVVAELWKCFPEKRRVQMLDVIAEVQGLLQAGAVSGEVLVRAARAQRAVLQADEGRSCPRVLRWVRDRRWADADASVLSRVTGVTGGTGAVTGVAAGAQPVRANWLATQAGVSAMGVQLGLGDFDKAKWRTFGDYTNAVRKEYAQRVRAGELATEG